MHRVTCERHTLPALLRLQWCNRNECSLLWYVQCATDARLEGKTGHGQCCYEGLLALKNSCLWPCLFFISEKSIWMKQTSTRLYFQSKNALRWWGLFSCVVSHADQQFHSAVKSSDWWGDIITLTKKTTTVLWCLPWGPYSSCTMVFTSTTTQYVEKNTGS